MLFTPLLLVRVAQPLPEQGEATALDPCVHVCPVSFNLNPCTCCCRYLR